MSAILGGRFGVNLNAFWCLSLLLPTLDGGMHLVMLTVLKTMAGCKSHAGC